MNRRTTGVGVLPVLTTAVLLGAAGTVAAGNLRPLVTGEECLESDGKPTASAPDGVGTGGSCAGRPVTWK